MSIKIKDLAKAMNVSQGTVSKALNDKDGIKKTAKEMEYTPIPIARKFSTKRSCTVGVFILSRDDIKLNENFGILFLDGIAEAAHNVTYDILFFTTTKEMSMSKSYIQMCEERQVDGAIFIGLASDDPHIEEIRKSKIPVVVIDSYVFGENVINVTSDNTKGVTLGMEYLYELGHRDIVFISGNLVSEVSKHRFNAFLVFMRSKCLLGKSSTYFGNFSLKSGYEAGRMLVQRETLPDAIFAANDYMAMGVMKALRESGIRVPDDISILGFDNVMACDYVEPGLSTVGQKAHEMGKEAFNNLLSFINKEDFKKEVLIAPKMIVRGSVKNNDRYK